MKEKTQLFQRKQREQIRLQLKIEDLRVKKILKS